MPSGLSTLSEVYHQTFNRLTYIFYCYTILRQTKLFEICPSVLYCSHFHCLSLLVKSIKTIFHRLAQAISGKTK